MEEVIEDGDDVVAWVHLTGRGKGSGVGMKGVPEGVGIARSLLCAVREGKIIYIYNHEDREAALGAAGLRE